MKLTREAFKRIGDAPPLDMFDQGIKAEETREKYTRSLRYVMCIVLEEMLEGIFEQRVEQFVRRGRESPGWILDIMINISDMLRRRTTLPHNDPEYYNPSSFANYFKPLKKLLEMNDVAIPWDRIYATFPEDDNIPDSRGWTMQEIRQMLDFARGPMDRAIILVLASSGIRSGALGLDWGHLTPVYRSDGELSLKGGEGREVACVMLSIYHGTSAQYPAFITPEAYDAVLKYRMKWANDVGREPRPDDPLFKTSGPFLRRAGEVSIKKRIYRMMCSAGLRAKDRKKNRRFDVPMMNGFRRFWNKTCKESQSKESPLASLIKKEYMMGHFGLVSNDRNYFKTHVLELAEEYVSVVPNLTIGDAARLAEKCRRQDEKIQRAQDGQDTEVAKLRVMVEELARRIGPGK